MLVVDDAYAEQIIALFGMQNLPVRAVPIGGGGGAPAGPTEAVQWNNAGAFAGTAQCTTQVAAGPVGPKLTLQATSNTESASEFRVLRSVGTYGAVLSYSDDPVAANRFSTCAGGGAVFQIDAFDGDLELKAAANIQVTGAGPSVLGVVGCSLVSLAAPGPAATIQASGWTNFLAGGAGAGSLFQANGWAAYQFIGSGPGTSVAWTGLEDWSFAGLGPTSSAEWVSIGSWLTSGVGAPGTTHTLQGFETYNVTGAGASAQLIHFGFASVQSIGLGAGAVYSTSAFQQHNFSGLGAVGSSWNVTGCEDVSFQGLALGVGTFEVDGFDIARVRATGGVELGPSGASTIRITPATEATKVAGRSLRWNGVGNVYEEASSTAAVGRYALAWVTGSPAIQVVVDLSALGIAATDRIQIQVEWSVKETGGTEEFCWYWGRAGAVQRGGAWTPVPNFFPASGAGSSAGPAPSSLVNGIGSATSIRIDCGVDAAFPSGSGQLVVSVVRV